MDRKKSFEKSELPAEEEEAKSVRASWSVRALRRVDPHHCMLHRSGEAEGVRKVRRMRAGASLGSRWERVHGTEPLVPAGTPGGTYYAVELLAQHAETGLVHWRSRVTKVTPGTIANNGSVKTAVVPRVENGEGCSEWLWSVVVSGGRHPQSGFG